MKDQNIEVKIEGDAKELVIRKGEAAPVVPFRTKVIVQGTIEQRLIT